MVDSKTMCFCMRFNSDSTTLKHLSLMLGTLKKNQSIFKPSAAISKFRVHPAGQDIPGQSRSLKLYINGKIFFSS